MVAGYDVEGICIIGNDFLIILIKDNDEIVTRRREKLYV